MKPFHISLSQEDSDCFRVLLGGGEQFRIALSDMHHPAACVIVSGIVSKISSTGNLSLCLSATVTDTPEFFNPLYGASSHTISAKATADFLTLYETANMQQILSPEVSSLFSNIYLEAMEAPTFEASASNIILVVSFDAGASGAHINGIVAEDLFVFWPFDGAVSPFLQPKATATLCAFSGAKPSAYLHAEASGTLEKTAAGKAALEMQLTVSELVQIALRTMADMDSVPLSVFCEESLTSLHHIIIT